MWQVKDTWFEFHNRQFLNPILKIYSKQNISAFVSAKVLLQVGGEGGLMVGGLTTSLRFLKAERIDIHTEAHSEEIYEVIVNTCSCNLTCHIYLL